MSKTIAFAFRLLKNFPLFKLCSASAVALIASVNMATALENELNLKYDFIGGGLRIMAASFDLKFDRKTYLVKTQIKTKGVASFFSNSVTYMGARGSLGANQPKPTEFQSRIESGSHKKSAHIFWQEKNRQAIDVQPKLKGYKKETIDRFLKTAFPDPLSALVSISFSAKNLCQNKIRAFDGRKVFDFKLKHLGQENLGNGEAGAYSGPAVKCAFKNIPIAGYSKKKMKKYQSKPTPAFMVWFAPVVPGSTRQTIYVPVKATGTINWASVKVNLTRAMLNGQPLSASQ